MRIPQCEAAAPHPRVLTRIITQFLGVNCGSPKPLESASDINSKHRHTGREFEVIPELKVLAFETESGTQARRQ